MFLPDALLSLEGLGDRQTGDEHPRDAPPAANGQPAAEAGSATSAKDAATPAEARGQDGAELAGGVAPSTSGSAEAAQGPRTADAASLAALQEVKTVLVQFHGEMVLLLHWSLLNYSGFCKILKKHDKHTGLLLRAPYVTSLLQQVRPDHRSPPALAAAWRVFAWARRHPRPSRMAASQPRHACIQSTAAHPVLPAYHALCAPASQPFSSTTVLSRLTKRAEELVAAVTLLSPAGSQLRLLSPAEGAHAAGEATAAAASMGELWAQKAASPAAVAQQEPLVGCAGCGSACSAFDSIPPLGCLGGETFVSKAGLLR